MVRYTDDPSIYEKDGEYYHVPRSFWVKVVYLIVGVLVLLAGLNFIWEPGGRILFGKDAEARVVRVERHIPGEDPQVFRYRREFEDERDRSITFKHFVAVNENGKLRTMQLGVDSRVKPYVNVNDTVAVSYYEGDEFAYGTWHARSWGIGVLYTVVGLCFVGTGIPMLLAVGKPIRIDPEAPPEAADPLDHADAKESGDGGQEPESGNSVPDDKKS